MDQVLFRRALVALFLAAASLTFAAVGLAEEDHLLGYKGMDTLQLKPGTVHAVTNQFGNYSCEVKGKAKFFFVPSEKDAGDDPRGGQAGHFVCYKVKCTGPLPPTIPVEEQLGVPDFETKKAQLLCLPTDKYVCGDGDLDPGEQCDGTDAAACPGSCQSDCTCPCDQTAPTCGGSCPAGQFCYTNGLVGSCGCYPDGSTPCADSGSPTCGGVCPAGFAGCVDSGGCTCF